MTTYNKPEIDFTAAVEVAARLLWEQACSEIEYDWQTNAEMFRKQASEILTLALPHLLPQISDDIAQVLEDEGRRREDSIREIDAITDGTSRDWTQGFAAGVYYAVPIVRQYGRNKAHEDQ